MFDWNDLKYFLAVARNGSTIAASKVLGTSQSTVHRRLKELEAQLGRSLVNRHSTGYRLTELGQAILAHAECVEEAAMAFERNVATSDQELSGSIRVTCPEAIGYRLLRSTMLPEFNARYPRLNVEFVMSDKVLDLAKGEADIAIRALPPSENALIGRRIASLPWAVYACRSYIEHNGGIERFEDIDRHTVVHFDGQMRNHHAARWLQSVAPRATVAARSDSLPTLLLAVKSGVGLAPLPVIVGRDEAELVQLLEPVPKLVSQIFLLMHQDSKRSARVRAFFDFFIERLSSIRPILGDAGHATQ